MALTNRASVKAQAGIPATDSSRDSQIDALIAGVASLVKQQLNRDFEAADYTEYYSGDNSAFLMLRQYPVNSITAIYDDRGGYFGDASGAFAAATLLVSGVDYCLMDGLYGKGGQGIVRRINDIWYGRPTKSVGTVEYLPPHPSGNIKVQYNAGYSKIPPAIQMGVNMLVAQLSLQAAAGGGASSMTYEDASVTYLTPDVASKAWGSIASTFAQYKSIPI